MATTREWFRTADSYRQVCGDCYRRGFVSGSCSYCAGWGVVTIRTLAKDDDPPRATRAGREG